MLKHFRASIIAMGMQFKYYIFRMCVCKLSYPELYYTDICDLLGSTIFSTLSQARQILGGKYWA
jgi:hypothetical protein